MEYFFNVHKEDRLVECHAREKVQVTLPTTVSVILLYIQFDLSPFLFQFQRVLEQFLLRFEREGDGFLNNIDDES